MIIAILILVVFALGLMYVWMDLSDLIAEQIADDEPVATEVARPFDWAA
jgi:hypothetical protein